MVLARRGEALDRERGAIDMLAALALGTLAVLASSSSARELYALPLLVPAAILGSRAVPWLPARWGWIASGAMGGAALVAVAVAWGSWGYGLLHGAAPPIAWMLRWLPRDFDFSWTVASVGSALLLTAAWGALWIMRPIPWLHLWVANLAVAWGVWMTLLLPWIDHAKSFRAPFAQIRAHIGDGCVGNLGLGEPQRAMLDYIADVKTQPQRGEGPRCRYLISQSAHDGVMPDLPAGDWALVWEGSRPGESRERFQLLEALAEGAIRTSDANGSIR